MQLFRLMLVFIVLFLQNVYAAECLSVFPAGTNSLAPPSEQLINFPANGSLDSLIDNTVLPRGNNLYLSSALANKDSIFVGPQTPTEKTARVFFRTSVAWKNIKINEGGNPEDLIIVIDGSLAVSGGQSVINAIVYVKGSVIVSGNPQINGAITSVGDLNIGTINVNYNENYITNADFNGMCEQPLSLPAVLVADFHFDECEYVGSPLEVIDETGNYPASSFGGLNTIELGQIERAAQLSDPNHHFETSIPLSPTYSISTWFKKPTSTNGNPYFILGSMDAGGDLMYIDRNNGWRWGVYSVSPSGSSDGNYSFNSLDNDWHHMVLVSHDDQTDLYIDGKLEDTVNRSTVGTLKYIGTSYDGVSGSNAQSFRAPLDEFMVFDGQLTPSEITDIYNNQSAKNNFDGSARIAPICNGVVHYSMDEPSWSGIPGEVIDLEGNLNGRAFNGANTSSLNSAIPGNPGTCGYGTFDGVDDFVQIADNPLLDLEKELTIAIWINIDSLPNSGLKSIMSKDENYEFHVNSSGGIFWWFSRHSFGTPGGVITPGQWHHVAVTYRSGRQVIYVDGVERVSRNFTGNLILNNDPLQIGQDQGFAGRYFNGKLDELKIYKKALNAAQVVNVYNETRPCAVMLDHFEIDTLDQQGLTCQPDNIVIKACADNTCSRLAMNNFNVNLLINGNLSQNVVVTNGSVNLNYSYTNAGIASLSLDQAYECTLSAGKPCDVTFSDTGFIFGTIPTQISGKPSDQGFNQTNLFLQAVKKSDLSNACVGAFPANTDVDVDLSYNCEIGVCSQPIVLTNNSIAHNISQTNSATNLRFSANSIANFSINYPNAGRLKLNAKKIIDVTDNQGNVSQLNFTGQSNAFVERPFAFKLDFDANTYQPGEGYSAANHLGTKFRKAGENFVMTATAIQWKSGLDADNDGIPNDADFNVINSLNNSPNNKAENFASEKLIVSSSMVLPTPATSGLLTQTDNSFSNSSVNNTYTFSEVGIIALSASLKDSDYLSTGNIFGKITNVGRFYPDHFTLEMSAVENSCNSFTYMDEPKLKLTYKIEARNSSNAITKNYDNDFVLSVVSLVAEDNNTDDLSSRLEDFNGTWVKGVYTSEEDVVPDEDLGRFSKIDKADGPYNNLFIGIKLEDPDLSALVDLDMNANTQDDCSAMGNCNAKKLAPIESQIRFGRWVMNNAYGPETHQVKMNHFIEQYNGSDFEVNSDESCIIPLITSKVPTGNIQSGGLTLFDYRLFDLNTADNLFKSDTNANVDGNKFVQGQYSEFVFSAPGVTKQGALAVEYEVPSWLKFDWSNADGLFNGPFIENPSSVVTFGRYRGNDRIIYWREN